MSYGIIAIITWIALVIIFWPASLGFTIGLLILLVGAGILVLSIWVGVQLAKKYCKEDANPHAPPSNKNLTDDKTSDKKD
jgi:hypothetical protein